MTLQSSLRPVAQTYLVDSILSRQERCMAWVSGAVAAGINDLTADFIDFALAEGIPVLKLKEVVLQNYLFCGFPAAIEGLIVLHNRLKLLGLEDANYREARDKTVILENGADLCRLIYGKTFDRLMQHMNQLSSDLADWMISEGYGKVLSRPILTIRERELCVVASLNVLRKERQLIAHLKGANKIGVSKSELKAVLEGNRLLTDTSVVAQGMSCLIKAGIVDGTQ